METRIWIAGFVVLLTVIGLSSAVGEVSSAVDLTKVTDITGIGPSGLCSNGWRFKLTQDIVVTDLGLALNELSPWRLDNDHTVRIYSTDGTVIVETKFYTGTYTPSSDMYFYTTGTTSGSLPVALLSKTPDGAEKEYVIAAYAQSLSYDMQIGQVIGNPFASSIVVTDASLQNLGLSMPTTHYNDLCQFLSASFKFTVEPVVPTPLTVTIEVPSSLNINGNGVIPVKIFGSATVDVSQIIIVDNDGVAPDETLRFNGLEVRVKSKGPQVSISDLNGDGIDDLMCHFVDDPSVWVEGGSLGVVTGFLQDGTPIGGETPINVVSE